VSKLCTETELDHSHLSPKQMYVPLDYQVLKSAMRNKLFVKKTVFHKLVFFNMMGV